MLYSGSGAVIRSKILSFVPKCLQWAVVKQTGEPTVSTQSDECYNWHVYKMTESHTGGRPSVCWGSRGGGMSPVTELSFKEWVVAEGSDGISRESTTSDLKYVYQSLSRLDMYKPGLINLNFFAPTYVVVTYLCFVRYRFVLSPIVNICFCLHIVDTKHYTHFRCTAYWLDKFIYYVMSITSVATLCPV